MADLERAKGLANMHWAWLQTLLEKVYKDAFTHGYKHGQQDSGKEIDNDNN